MTGLSTDFSKIRTKSYKMWRILQAPGIWAQIYRDREQKFRDYRTAVIFPEQIIGLNQSEIYSVATSTPEYSSRTRTVTLHTHSNFELILKVAAAESVGEIVEWESSNHASDAISDMRISSPHQSTSRPFFASTNLFTSKKDAIKFAQKAIATF